MLKFCSPSIKDSGSGSVMIEPDADPVTQHCGANYDAMLFLKISRQELFKLGTGTVLAGKS